MRGLFLALLLANVLFFAWQFMHQQPRGVHTNLRQSGEPAIVLLSEVESTTAGEIEPAEITVAEPAPMPEEVISEEAVMTEPETVPEPAPTVAAAPPVEKSDGTIACYTLGPFRELDKLRRVTRLLKDKVLEASFRSREEKEQSMFWVYLQPQPDMKAARATTRKLRKKKIKDSYIIAKGDKRFGISLGHFKEQPRAYTLRDRIKKLGFKPMVEPVFRNYTIYWLDYKVSAGQNIQQALDAAELELSVNRFDRSCQ